MASALPMGGSDCCDTRCENGGGTSLELALASILTHDTLAALAASTYYINDLVATVLGGATKGDGLGGTFYFDSSSMAADNGSTVIRPTAIDAGAPGRWIRTTSVPQGLLYWNGDPNGNVVGNIGWICVDTSEPGKVWTKTTGNGTNTGWTS